MSAWNRPPPPGGRPVRIDEAAVFVEVEVRGQGPGARVVARRRLVPQEVLERQAQDEDERPDEQEEVALGDRAPGLALAPGLAFPHALGEGRLAHEGDDLLPPRVIGPDAHALHGAARRKDALIGQCLIRGV